MLRVLVVLFALQGISPLSNVQVTVPSLHQAHSPLEVNCDYNLDADEADQVVLTWYFNESPIPIYQWVPGLSFGPQVIHDLFKDNLDLEHEAYSDELKKHAALRIPNPDQRFSGIYKCRISTFTEEFSSKESVLIYNTPAEVSISSKNGGDISCAIRGVFPLPSVILSWTTNGTVFSSQETEVTPNDVGTNTMDVLIKAAVDESSLKAHDMVTCEVSIEGTEYNERIEQPIIDTIDIPDSSCSSAACDPTSMIEEDQYEPFTPEASEAIENNVATGTGINILSGEAAKFVESAGCWLKVNLLLVLFLFISAIC